VLRRESPEAEVGIALALTHTYPATDSEGDRAAAWWADGSFNRWYLDPLYGRGYPDDMVEHFGSEGPPVQDGDLETIATPTDFLGANYYFRQVVSEDPDGGRPILVRDSDWSFTAMGWEVYPDGLHDLLVRLRDDYSPPVIYIFENGAAYDDLRGHNGDVADPERQAYLAEHLAAVGRAIEDGVPVRGYFAWSLLDNFEWAEGYSKRFGIVYVDYPTLERVPKGSFYWYRDFIAAQRTGAEVPWPVSV
jgi:beta-glucosidase